MIQGNLAECRVAVMGLGLMGGSIALALRGKVRSISGYDIDPDAIQQALDLGVIDDPIDLAGPIDPIDLLVLAVPVSAILDWITQLPKVFAGSFHLIDLGSTKSVIVEAMSQLPDRISPLGGHPMCGKESSGLAVAEASLFQDRTFALTPLDRTLPSTLSLAQQLIAAIGSRPLILDAERHDRLAAAISHVPYLTSIALVAAATTIDDELIWNMVASGFRDSTRLAASDVTMMLDILVSNRTAVLNGLGRLQTSLHELTTLIEQNDRSSLQAHLNKIRDQRIALNT
jgi:prephenate dehydrogenase